MHSGQCLSPPPLVEKLNPSRLWPETCAFLFLLSFHPSMEKLRQQADFPGVPSFGVSRSPQALFPERLWRYGGQHSFVRLQIPGGSSCRCVADPEELSEPLRRYICAILLEMALLRRCCSFWGSPGDVGAEELQSITFAGKTELTSSKGRAVACSQPSAAHPNLHLLPHG